MKNTTVIVAIIAGLSLIISAKILSSAIEQHGENLSNATSFSRFPHEFKVSLESEILDINLHSKP